MRRLMVLVFVILAVPVKGITIDYPPNIHIKERTRTDIDPIFRFYVVPREIQFHSNAIKEPLPYFLRCVGSGDAINFTVPPSATKHLSLDTDPLSHSIKATLQRNQFDKDLVGRYTCSEVINDKKYETSAYVYIEDGVSVFTKTQYPTVLRHTGIHFLNLPCQTTSWFPRMSCPMPAESQRCSVRPCSKGERRENELKCNTPVCEGQEPCIPVYFTPATDKAQKVHFDPQIGFALENPTSLPKSVTNFICMSNYTQKQQSKVPFESSASEYVNIHQSSLNVLSDEKVTLSCEISYGTKINQKAPTVFWFEDIHGLQLIANETEKPAFNNPTQLYSRNTSITLRGFQPKQRYRFYCVRASEQGIYSGSIDVTCDEKPSLDLYIDISSDDSGKDNRTMYGANTIYDITIYTVPRSSIILEILRDGVSLTNDKQFELLLLSNKENQFYDYALTIYSVTFEDEKELNITVTTSKLQTYKTIKPIIIGNPVGQFAFVPDQLPLVIPWRKEDYRSKNRVFAYGILENESYRVVCSVQHRADVPRPLNVFIQHSECPVDGCLTSVIDTSCRTSSGRRLTTTPAHRVNEFQTQFASVDLQVIDNPSTGHQYVCCYQQNEPIVLSKALTTLANNRSLFTVQKPEFGLVTGDSLTYRCVGHDLVYDDLVMVYNDGMFTYERNSIDTEWRVKGTNQVRQIDLDWYSPTSENIRDTTIEVKTAPLTMPGPNGYLQCTALSKRPDSVPNINDTFLINVDTPITLKFKKPFPPVAKFYQKTGDNLVFDCTYEGRPQPKVIWFKGKAPLTNDNKTLQFGANNESISITRAQALDTGYYTCELNNGRDPSLRRSFDLRVKGTNPYSKFGRFIGFFVIILAVLFLLMLILFIYGAIKYYQMKKIVDESIFHGHSRTGTIDGSKLAASQVTNDPLPDNFASTQQTKRLLGLVNGEIQPASKEDFKELGRGQYGVVYQVRLPEIELVAAKLLPDSIRNTDRRRAKRKKSDDTELRTNSTQSLDTPEEIAKREAKKTKAAEMLIDEMKVMGRAGKHLNIVALKKVAYPEAKLKFLFTGGLIRDEDSFYIMELCSNGSLESMLKRFLQSPPSSGTSTRLSLYETLVKQPDRSMTVVEAHSQCVLKDDDLKLIAYQVACGVDYLNRKGILHGDIAARNVLVNARFIMKVCDFGLATYTNYKSLREKLARHENVQLEKKTNELATHNLTPELAIAFLRASTPDERLLLNKAWMKADVWSFGIFLWTLFLQCRSRPFERLLEETRRDLNGPPFFHRLAQVISKGRVLEYIDKQPEIPNNIYAIIRKCLDTEDNRPSMAHVRDILCHSEMLSKQAFEYYREEHNRYQGEIQGDNGEIFSQTQGVNAPSNNDTSDGNVNSLPPRHDPDVTFRPSPTSSDIDYPTTTDDTTHPFLSQSDRDENEQRHDSYLQPTTKATSGGRTIAGNVADETKPLISQDHHPSITTTQELPPRGRRPAPLRPAPPPPVRRNEGNDSYL